MNEMIERIGRRLHDRFHEDSVSRRDGDTPEDMWDREPDQGWWLSLAKDQIAAMREPTEGMLNAVMPPHEAFSGQWREYAEHDWRTMIDAALKDV